MNSWIDLKYAFRLLAKKPGFTAITILIMSLGLGLCIYNYSFMYSAALKAVPFENGDRIYSVDIMSEGTMSNGHVYDLYSYNELQKQQQSFEYLDYMQQLNINVSGGDRAVKYEGVKVNPDFFDLLSTNPVIGRAFNHNDMENAEVIKVVLISHYLWQNYFGGAQDIIDRDVFLNGTEYRVIGVMPEGFAFPMNHDIWIPQDLSLFNPNPKNTSVKLFGMVKEGISADEAELDLQNIYRRLAQEDKEAYSNRLPILKSFPLSFMGNGTPAILGSMTLAVIFVLLLACTNVANLLFARASERAKETAIRVALGASNGRLIMQMMWESVIICVFGGVIAILLAQVGLELTSSITASMVQGRPPYFWNFGLDPHILSISIIIIVVTALVTGLLPAWKIISGDFNQVLRDGTRGAQSRSSSRISKILVVFEVALSCALLSVAAMVSVGSHGVNNADYGVDPEGMLTARITLPRATYPNAEEQSQFYFNLIEDLKSQPGIDVVAGANPLPGDGAWYRPVDIEGFEKTDNNSYPRARSVEMYPGSMEELGIRLVEGRFFETSDDANSEHVVIVTDTFVKKYFANEPQILGKQVRYVAGDGEDEFKWMTIIGVVEHLVFGQPYMPWKMQPSVLTPTVQHQWRAMSLAIKGSLDQASMIKQLNSSLQKLDKNVPAYEVRSYKEKLRRNTAGMNFVANIFSVFAIVALFLAATGIYGVIANSVQLRTQELGIRRALGAEDSSVVSMLMKQGRNQLMLGVLIGLPVAYLLGSNMLEMMGAEPFWVYSMLVVMPILIACVVLAATYMPAKRAIALEPSAALRYE